MSSPSWQEYLDAVEAAALDVKDSLLAGRTPRMPVLRLPDGPPSAQEETRRVAVAALVEEVTRFLVSNQDIVREKLASLPHPQRAATAHTADTLGGRFDLSG